MSTAPLGEFELIAKYFAPFAAPGGFDLKDDAALLSPLPGHDLVLTKDVLVAGVHFFADDPPGAIARKALRVNLSDLAAKGASPLGFLIGLGLPKGWTEPWLAAFSKGLCEDAAAHHCPLLGGDTVSTPERLTVSITAIGSVPTGRMVKRSGARPGHLLYVTGTIGDGALGLIERQKQRRTHTADTDLVRRYLLPEPRLGLAGALIAHASAAMDISDGLIGDAGKMASASGVAIRLDLSRTPFSPGVRRALAASAGALRTAVTGGDDYEILCAIPPDAAAPFEAAARAGGEAVTRIGIVAEGAGIATFDASGTEVHFGLGSYAHF